MSYKARKQITLPSGAKCSIRKLSSYDFIGIGDLPMVGGTGRARNGHGDSGPSQAEVTFGIACSKIALLKCCGPIETEGLKLRIVDKPFADCGETEICIEDLPQADAEMIVREVTALSGMTKEADLNVRTFPEKPETCGANSPGGELVSQATN